MSSNLTFNDWIASSINRVKDKLVSFFTEYRIIEAMDSIGQYLENHPFLCIMLIAVVFSCSVPVILFVLFTIVSLLITFMGFVIIEGTILGLGFAIMMGFLLCLLLVILSMAAMFSTAYFTFEQICHFLVKSQGTENLNSRRRERLNVS